MDAPIRCRRGCAARLRPLGRWLSALRLGGGRLDGLAFSSLRLPRCGRAIPESWIFSRCLGSFARWQRWFVWCAIRLRLRLASSLVGSATVHARLDQRLGFAVPRLLERDGFSGLRRARRGLQEAERRRELELLLSGQRSIRRSLGTGRDRCCGCDGVGQPGFPASARASSPSVRRRSSKSAAIAASSPSNSSKIFVRIRISRAFR